MASVRKKDGSKYWFACWTDHTGRQRQKSTRETNRKKAQAVADALEGAYRQRLAEIQTRKLLSEMLTEIHGNSTLSVSARDFFEEWLKAKKVETAESSWLRYKRIVAAFLEWLGEKAEGDIAMLSAADFEAYRNAFTEGHSIASANLVMKVLRAVMEEAKRKGFVSDNPAALVRNIKKRDEENGRRPFTIEELKKLLEVAGGEWRGLILFGLYTGQRLGDIARLRWANVDLAQSEVALSTRKTGRRIVLPLAPPLEKYLLSLAAVDDPDAPIFPTTFEVVATQGRVGSLSNQFHRLMASAGLVEPRTHAKKLPDGETGRAKAGLGFHCLRHTATSLMKNAGINATTVMDVIGHDSEAVSRVYTHVDRESKEKALASLPDLTQP